MQDDFTLNFQAGEQFLRNAQPYINLSSSRRYPADTKIVVQGATMLPVWLPEVLKEVSVVAVGAPNQVRQVAVLAEVSEDRQTLTITPRQPWPVGQQTVQLPKLQDGFGNALPMSHSFRVGADPIPSEPPTVYGTTPIDGAVDVPVTVFPAVFPFRADFPCATRTSVGSVAGRKAPGRKPLLQLCLRGWNFALQNDCSQIPNTF